MSSWNVKLARREQSISVREILERTETFVLVRLSNGRQQKLSDANLPQQWQQVKKGSKIDLTIGESVVWAGLRPKAFQQKLHAFINNSSRKLFGPYYLWACGTCQIMDHVTYDEGDESEIIAGKIESAHAKEMKPECRGDRLNVYDHRGIFQEGCSKLIALRIAQYTKKEQTAASRT